MPSLANKESATVNFNKNSLKINKKMPRSIDYKNINKNFVETKEGMSKINLSLLKLGWIQKPSLERVNACFVLATYHLPKKINKQEKEQITKVFEGGWPNHDEAPRYTLAQELTKKEGNHLHILLRFNNRPEVKLNSQGVFERFLIRLDEIEISGTYHTITRGKISNVHQYIIKEDEFWISTLTNDDLSIIIKPPHFTEIAKTGNVKATIAALEEANLKKSVHDSVFSYTVAVANMIKTKKNMASKKIKYPSKISPVISEWVGYPTLYVFWDFSTLFKNDPYFSDLYKVLSSKFETILVVSDLDDLIVQQQVKDVDLLLIDYGVFVSNQLLGNSELYVSCHTRNCQSYVPVEMPRVVFSRSTDVNVPARDAWVGLYTDTKVTN